MPVLRPDRTQWSASTPEHRKAQLRDKFDGGAPAPGVLAFSAGNPGGDQVWSVSCFVVAPGRRRTGVARALLAAAVEHALAHGADVVEG